jgi:1,4-alpha-glucan branching enzyme
MSAIVRAEHSDPFRVLGIHLVDLEGTKAIAVRAFLPEAKTAWVLPLERDARAQPMQKLHPHGFFQTLFPGRSEPFPYRLRLSDHQGHTWEVEDPYRFPPLLTDFDLHLIAEGTHSRAYEKLGAHLRDINGVRGVNFAVWAPNAKRVSVVGPFNHWDGRRHPACVRGSSGVWELFVPGLGEGQRYQYEIKSRFHDALLVKADPYSFSCEQSPKTASLVCDLGGYQWNDAQWMRERGRRNSLDAPLAIYEVHLGSWMRVPEERRRFLTYRELAPSLAEYVRRLGFTHVEFLPVMEHPFYGSWGYQLTGYFAPTSRYGTPHDFKYLVDYLHQQGIGVILDWVPSHFPTDPHGLGFFDGTHLYEHADPQKGLHPDWNSFIFNYDRNEVRTFLLSSAHFWLDCYHADGLRVDAVASMLYLDYSRKEGEWVPNEYGGRENLQAIAFLRHLNGTVYANHPDVQTIAEESTAWPMVSRPTDVGGLGFGLKWDMGWMHDTLEYMSQDPLFRNYHHQKLTFRLLYAFTENFLLPLSHDEVVHGKGSLLAKMPGEPWQKLANLRLLLAYMYAHPGKKLIFMGTEFGQWREWNHEESLDWHLTKEAPHQGVQKLVADLNHLYITEISLHALDLDPRGFEWIDAQDSENSVISFLRKGRDPGEFFVFAFNFTPVPRQAYRIGLNQLGPYREVLNTDSAIYGGSDVGNFGRISAEPIPWHGRPFSASLTIPPLGAIGLKPERG